MRLVVAGLAILLLQAFDEVVAAGVGHFQLLGS
jgi:hypothetical protein